MEGISMQEIGFGTDSVNNQLAVDNEGQGLSLVSLIGKEPKAGLSDWFKNSCSNSSEKTNLLAVEFFDSQDPKMTSGDGKAVAFQYSEDGKVVVERDNEGRVQKVVDSYGANDLYITDRDLDQKGRMLMKLALESPRRQGSLGVLITERGHISEYENSVNAVNRLLEEAGLPTRLSIDHIEERDFEVFRISAGSGKNAVPVLEVHRVMYKQ